MRKATYFHIAATAAGLAALAFLAHSLLSLIGFALSRGAITMAAIPPFILNNFATLVNTFQTISFICALAIYGGFIVLAKSARKPLLVAGSVLVLLILALPVTTIAFPALEGAISFKIKDTSTALAFFLFGIALLSVRSRSSALIASLSTLYFFQSIMLLSSLFIPVRIADVMIAIFILHVWFFREEARKS